MKQTEVGLIPEDWNDLNFGSLCDLVKTKYNPVLSLEERNCVELEHIESASGRIIGTTSTNLTLSLKTVFSKGDILFGKLRPYLRKYALPKFDGVCTTEIWVFDSRNHHKPFLYYVVQSNKFIEAANLSTGTKMPRADWATVAKLKIAVPPLPEQQAIAEALSDADAWIEGLESLIEKKRLIKQGAMQELLLPKDGWEKTTFDETFYFLRTASYSRADLDSDGYAGYIHYGDIHTKWSNILDVQKATLPKISQEMLKSHSLVKTGDIIMADASEDYSGVGKSIEVININDAKIVAGLHTFLLRQKSDLFSPKFFGYFIHSKYIKTQLDTLATGLKVYSISKSALKQVEILYPTTDVQTHIASTLFEMDSELDTLEQKLLKARQIKQGMMQQLLTGKIRLVKLANAKAAKTLKRATA